jgi:hypothetical protein
MTNQSTQESATKAGRCSSCAMTRDERIGYIDGCPMRRPEHGCPFYDKPSAAPVQPENWLEKIIEALELGAECALEVANDYHERMAGYKQQRHDQLDADVRQIKDAIAVARVMRALPQAAQPQQQDSKEGDAK